MGLLIRLVLSALVLAESANRDTFEYVTFTPPAGWLVAHAEGGRQYVRNEAGGIGIINLLPSRPSAGAPAEIFEGMWRDHAAKVIAGPAPRPAARQDGDVTILTGRRDVTSQGTAVRVVVTTVLRNGRALGVIGMAMGPVRQRELDEFLATLRTEPSSTAATPAPSDALVRRAGSTGELGFDAPAGYAAQRNGGVVILAPRAASEGTPCVYGIAPARPSSGNLDADAESALLEVVVPGWRRLDDRYAAMRGVSAAGWRYSWYRAAFEGEIGGNREYVNAMAMVLPAGEGQVHVVWGMGIISRCLLEDAPFEELFHSLRPDGWKSDEGEALRRRLVGKWRYTASSGMQQLTFMADGRFDRDLGSRVRIGVSERTSAAATGGRFTLRNGELTLVPDHRPQDPDRYRVRVHDEWMLGEWRPAIALFDANASPPLVITYYRVREDDR